MKNLKWLLLSFTLLLIGMVEVKAETKPVDASIKLVGRNTFGRELEIEVDCKDAGTSSCYLSDAKWYYNDTNETSGGTEIVGNDDVGGSGYKNYSIEEELIGKYIYVVATVYSYDNDYEEITVTDITDANTNVTDVVDNYIKYIDNDNYSISSSATFQVGASLTLTLNGVSEKEGTDIFVYLSNGEEVPIKETSQGCTYPETDVDDYTKFKDIYNNKISVADDWYLLNGYKDAYVIMRTHDKTNGGYYCEVTKEPITIAKPEIPSLGNRFKFYLFSDDEFKGLSTFPLFPYDGESGSHQLITKIGIINDNELLKKLSKNTSGSLSLLLEYAQKNEGTTFKYSDEHYYDNDIGTFSVKDGAYYYVYTSYENTDGTYRDLSDVSVVMGDAGMLVNEVKWESFDEETISATWEKFVIDFKAHEFVKSYTEDDSTKFEIKYDASSLSVTLEEVTTTFTYEDGIVTYSASDTRGDAELFVDSIWQIAALETFTNTFNYDLEEFVKYMKNNEDLTISKDGIEYVLKEFSIKEEENGSSLNIDGDAFTTLKFDLVNGAKNYKVASNPNTDKPLDKSPETGYIGIGIVSLIALGGIYSYIKANRKNKIVKL